MDYLQTDILRIVIITAKICFVVGGCAIVILNYFQTKETKKMERKLNIILPGSAHLAIAIQFGLSIVFVFAATLALLLA